MREAYHTRLGQLADQLGGMCAMATDAMERATTALLDADLSLSEQVISDDAKMDEARTLCEEHAFGLLALQAPVATDLRTVVAAMHAAESLERMGDLALHVAKVARRRHPQCALPEQVRAHFAEMGRVAAYLGGQAERVIKTQDVVLARKMEQDDDEMDNLHRNLFGVLMDPQWPYGVAAAVDVTLLGRFYERFADHTVSVASRVIFVVTGRLPSPDDEVHLPLR
jgi:phosphate transport system protein